MVGITRVHRLVVCLLSAAAAAAAAVVPGAAQAAGTLTLPASSRWVVIASRQSLDEATALARSYGTEVRDVRVVRAANGWFAVVAGPVAATSVERARAALNTATYLPGDLYLSRGEPYTETVWTAPPPVVLAGASYEGTQRVDLQAEGLSVTLDSERQKDGTGIPTAVVRVGGSVALTTRIDDNPNDPVRSQARIVRLDRTSPRPQVVFSYYWGGAHCCTVSKVLTALPSGTWVAVDAPTLDGEGFSYEDIDGDGTTELVAVDNSFLYAFDSYAGSFAPTVLYKLDGSRLRKVTLEPAYRSHLVDRLRRWETMAREQPDLWRSNGFLAGWVAAKAQLGQVDEAWPRMLATYDRASDFGPQTCLTGQPVDKCPQGSLRKVPFPDALRAHLLEQGYAVPAAASAAPAPGAAPGSGTMSYADAQAAFNALAEPRKYELQMLLAAAGYWPAVGTDQFSRRLHESILRFQAEAGLDQTGMIQGQQWAALQSRAAPVLSRWGLRLLRHPVTGTPLWVPEGLGLTRTTTKSGIVLERADRSLRISFDAYQGVGLEAAYRAVLGAIRPPATVNYKVIRPDFFVVSSGQGDVGSYVRFHAQAGGIVGFHLAWAPVDGNAGDRLSTLMSDLFRASVSLGQERVPPTPALAVAVAPPSTAVAPKAPVAPEAKRAPSKSSSGSGFFVTPEGHILTNAHVVDGCTATTVSHGDERGVQARILARDTTNDLALLKVDTKPADVASLRTTIRLGEPVAVFGFPLTGLLAAGGNFTLGNVTALAGLRDDSRILQISAPVQPGNSGGPLVDEMGAVVGVVVAKLNALKLAIATDDIPQNVNFAIKAGVAASFAEAQGLTLRRAPAEAPVLRPADLADKARAAAVLIECTK